MRDGRPRRAGARPVDVDLTELAGPIDPETASEVDGFSRRTIEESSHALAGIASRTNRSSPP